MTARRDSATAAIYARISLDRRDGEGVARQLDDCRRLAADHGWTVDREYVDNDVSAFRARRRPAWEQLLDDIAAGHVEALVAWHPDRLYRRLSDLERFAELAKAHRLEVVTVRAGDLDLGSATGRMIAGILGSVARGESERMGERVSRAKQQRAAEGRPAGGGLRPFGYLSDRVTPHEAEAQALAAAAAAIIAGGSYNAQVTRLNEAGITTTAGRQWTVGSLRRTLTSPRVAGLRAYKGEIVGPAVWPPIIDPDTWERLRYGAAGRARPGRPPLTPYLLRGLLVCGACGRPLYGARIRRGVVYRCPPAHTTSGKGCGLSITAHPTERYVADTVRGWLAGDLADAAADHLGAGPTSARAELDDVDARMVTLAQRWAAGAISDAEHDAARKILADRRARAEASIDVAPVRAPKVTVADLAAAWDHGAVDTRRDLIGALAATPIVVAPGRSSDRRVVPIDQRVRVVPAWG